MQYRPGWDCHGLPIELKAVRKGKGLAAGAIRERAGKLARETVEKQKESFKGWGVMGEWDQAYLTMEAGFERRQLEVFRTMSAKGG